jgi:5-methylcytosine-specific restriction protein A
MSINIGEMLNQRWNIGAQHALYHKGGIWHHQLTSFPGALCDPFGYMLFSSGTEFRSCSKLRIDQDVNVSGHISEIPGYVRVPEVLAYSGH